MAWLSTHLKRTCPTINARVEFIASRLLARPLRPSEMDIILNSLNQLSADYEAHPEEAAKLLAVGELKVDSSLGANQLAAWTMLANQLLNLDEVLNK